MASSFFELLYANLTPKPQNPNYKNNLVKYY